LSLAMNSSGAHHSHLIYPPATKGKAALRVETKRFSSPAGTYHDDAERRDE
jgi:hypothetical protein